MNNPGLLLRETINRVWTLKVIRPTTRGDGAGMTSCEQISVASEEDQIYHKRIRKCTAITVAPSRLTSYYILLLLLHDNTYVIFDRYRRSL